MENVSHSHPARMHFPSPPAYSKFTLSDSFVLMGVKTCRCILWFAALGNSSREAVELRRPAFVALHQGGAQERQVHSHDGHPEGRPAAHPHRQGRAWRGQDWLWQDPCLCHTGAHAALLCCRIFVKNASTAALVVACTEAGSFLDAPIKHQGSL